MNSRKHSCKTVLALTLALSLTACGVAMTEGEKWLDSKIDPPEMNIAGTWVSPEWGVAHFKQTKREVRGMLGDYPVRGVASGNELYLLMYAGDKVHYSAKLKALDENIFEGLYSKYSIVDEAQSDSASRRISLRRVSKDVPPGDTDAVRSQTLQESKSTQESAAPIPAERKPKITKKIKLRDRAEANFSDLDLQMMIKDHNFFSKQFNAAGNFPNELVDNKDGTVTDKVTGLMWQKAGSFSEMFFDVAGQYVQELNSGRFGGYGDWRLPTMEELCSLLEGTPNRSGKFMDNLFDSAQTLCWSADVNPRYRITSIGAASVRVAFYVNFIRGETSAGVADRFIPRSYAVQQSRCHVKAVRTAE